MDGCWGRGVATTKASKLNVIDEPLEETHGQIVAETLYRKCPDCTDDGRLLGPVDFVSCDGSGIGDVCLECKTCTGRGYLPVFAGLVEAARLVVASFRYPTSSDEFVSVKIGGYVSRSALEALKSALASHEGEGVE